MNTFRRKVTVKLVGIAEEDDPLIDAMRVAFETADRRRGQGTLIHPIGTHGQRSVIVKWSSNTRWSWNGLPLWVYRLVRRFL